MPLDRTQLKFARTHEWISVEGNQAVVGISDFAVQALTDLVFIQLPSPGQSFEAGEIFGEVESVKAVSDLYAPVACKILAVNEELPNHLEWLSEDPFGKGWILKLELGSDATLENLLSHSDYQKYCDSEAH